MMITVSQVSVLMPCGSVPFGVVVVVYAAVSSYGLTITSPYLQVQRSQKSLTRWSVYICKRKTSTIVSVIADKLTDCLGGRQINRRQTMVLESVSPYLMPHHNGRFCIRIM